MGKRPEKKFYGKTVIPSGILCHCGLFPSCAFFFFQICRELIHYQFRGCQWLYKPMTTEELIMAQFMSNLEKNPTGRKRIENFFVKLPS